MEIVPVDPRDSRWEEFDPAFRVYFWDRTPAPSGMDLGHVMWHSQERRLTGAGDVLEVLAWATGPAGQGRRFELFVEATSDHGPGLVRLAGTSPAGPGSG